MLLDNTTGTRRQFLTLGTLALGGALAAYLNLPKTECYESYLLSAGNQGEIDVIGRNTLYVGDSMVEIWYLPNSDKVGLGGHSVDSIERIVRQETKNKHYGRIVCFAGTAEQLLSSPEVISNKLRSLNSYLESISDEVVMLSPFPSSDSKEHREKIQRIIQLTPEIDVNLLPFHDSLTPHDFYDRVHLNSSGYKKLEDYLFSI